METQQDARATNQVARFIEGEVYFVGYVNRPIAISGYPDTVPVYESHEQDETKSDAVNANYSQWYINVRKRNNCVGSLNAGDVAVILSMPKGCTRVKILSRIGVVWIMRHYLVRQRNARI